MANGPCGRDERSNEKHVAAPLAANDEATDTQLPAVVVRSLVLGAITADTIAATRA
jgi:hypothetical protein